MSTWIDAAIFYHIYPLGLLGAPTRNDVASPPVPRLRALEPWIDHARDIGCTALYLGPLFESTSHGYDTASYTQVDRRLGSNDDLAKLVSFAHDRGVRVILDGVFHHVGRDFPHSAISRSAARHPRIGTGSPESTSRNRARLAIRSPTTPGAGTSSSSSSTSTIPKYERISSMPSVAGIPTSPSMGCASTPPIPSITPSSAIS